MEAIPDNSVILDTKPLVLLIVGTIDRNYISKFEKTKGFTPENYDALLDCVSRYKFIIVTPYVINELSHHTIEFKKFRDDYRKKVVLLISEMLKDNLTSCNPSVENIFQNTAIYVMGSADTSLLELDSGKNPIITSDGPFADQVNAQGKSALKFIETVGFAAY